MSRVQDTNSAGENQSATSSAAVSVESEGVGQVPANGQAEVVPHRSRRGFCGASGPHGLPDGGDRRRAFPDHGHDWGGSDVVDQSLIEGLASMDGVVSFGQGSINLEEFGCDQPQPALFESGSDFADQAASGRRPA